MLNNMVSPIDHVVMNHQNQTRTNDIWGHVRYTGRVETTREKKLYFWHMGPNCNSMGLLPYPLLQIYDGWVRREG
jgi:hypothetical protein